MPIYEYRCENGHTFETLQRMSDDPLTACETCGAPASRVLHAPAVHFKGSGFYNTDYGTKKRARELRSAGEGKGKDAGSKDGGSSTATSDASKTSSGSDGAKKSDSSPKSSAA